MNFSPLPVGALTQPGAYEEELCQADDDQMAIEADPEAQNKGCSENRGSDGGQGDDLQQAVDNSQPENQYTDYVKGTMRQILMEGVTELYQNAGADAAAVEEVVTNFQRQIAKFLNMSALKGM
eukprot:gene5395-5617_t